MDRQEEQEKYPKYLKDAPTSLHSHPVTAVIANEIEQSREGQIIGLLGSWGSGKSSIIEGIKAEFNKENKEAVAIIEYDAWKNEGYPFKRGFLKSILPEIDKGIEDSANRATVNDKIDELYKKTETKEELKYELLNFPNILIAAPVLLYPIAFNMLKEKTSGIPFQEIFSIQTVVFYNSGFWAFAFACLVLALNIYINRRTKTKLKDDKTKVKEVVVNLLVVSFFMGFFSSISASFILIMPLAIWSIFQLSSFVEQVFNPKENFNILQGTQPKIKSTITTECTPEPNFKNFTEVYLEALKKINENKIIIIIDNIDRIEVDEARKIWTSLKGMVLKDAELEDKNRQMSKVHIIIPVDEGQVAEIFGDNRLTPDCESTSFVQKTFDVVYKVPATVLTKARELWNEKLKEAFGDLIPENEIDEIISIFDDTRNYEVKNGAHNAQFKTSSYRGNATPRKIIRLINEVVSLQKLDMNKEISYSIKFAFCLHYNNINYKFSNRESDNLLPNNHNKLIEIEKNNKKELAALYYAAPPDEAITMVIDVAETMENEISEFPQEFRNTWIWDVIFQHYNQKRNLPFPILSRILHNLDAVNRENPNNKFNSVVNKILKEMSELEEINTLEEASISVFGHILKDEHREQAEKILNLLLSYKGNVSSDFVAEAQSWLEFLKGLMLYFNNDKQIYTCLPASLYARVVPLIMDADEMAYLNTESISADNLEGALKGLEYEQLYKHLDFIINKYPAGEERNYDDLKMKIVAEKIKGNLKEHPETYTLLLDFLINYSKSEDMQSFIKSSEYVQCLAQIKNNYNVFGMATAIYLRMDKDLSELKKYNSQLSQQTQIESLRQQITQSQSQLQSYSHNRAQVQQQIFNLQQQQQRLQQQQQEQMIDISNNDATFIQAFVETYAKLSSNSIMSLFEVAGKFNNRTQIMGNVIENADKFDIDMMQLFEKFDNLQRTYPNLHKLLDKVLTKDNAAEILQELTFGDNNNELLYHLAGRNAKQHIKVKANEYLNGITKESWVREIWSYSTKFKIAVLLDYSGTEFDNALDILPKIIAQNTDKFFKDMGHELKVLTEMDKRTNFVEKLLNEHLTSEDAKKSFLDKWATGIDVQSNVQSASC